MALFLITAGEFYLLGGVALDYETTEQYVYQVEIEDYIDQQTTSTFTLTIIVSNINEQPTFAATPSAVTIDEAAVCMRDFLTLKITLTLKKIITFVLVSFTKSPSQQNGILNEEVICYLNGVKKENKFMSLGTWFAIAV